MPKLNLANFLDSISISGATDHTWEAVVDAGYTTLASIQSLTVPVLAALTRDSGVRIGDVNAAKILGSLHSERIQALLAKSEAWLTVDALSVYSDASPTLLQDVTGKRICLTGTGPAERPVLAAALKAGGAIIQSSVSSTTQILLSNGIGKSKELKAAAMGVKVLPYTDFFPA